MSERNLDLLFLRTPSVSDRPKISPPVPPEPTRPSFESQSARIKQKEEWLTELFSSSEITFDVDGAEISPEYTLVFILGGSIDSFETAINKLYSTSKKNGNGCRNTAAEN